MRKSMKKVLATTCVAGLCVSALAGCTSTPKTSSMTEVMNVASELDSYSYSYEVDITTESEGSMSMELYGNCTKDAVSMSVKIKSIDIEDMDLDYDAKNILVATKDALYINLAEVEDEFLAEMDLGTYGLDADWIKLDYGMEMEVSSSTEAIDTLLEDFEEAYGDLIDEDDGEYSIVIDDNDSAKEVLEATATMLEENAEEWAELFVSMYDEFDYETFTANFVTSLCKEINKTYDLGMTSSEIEREVEAMMEEIDFSQITTELDSEYYAESFNALAAEIRESIEEVDIADSEIEISASQDGSEYVTEVKVDYVDYYSEELIEISVKSTIVAEKVEVKVPSEDIMTVEEAICVLLEEFGGDIEAEDAEELLDNLESVLDDVDLSGMSGMMGYPSVDMDAVDDWDDYEDYDWDEEW